MVRRKNPQVAHPLAETDLIQVNVEWDEGTRTWTTFVPQLNNISTFGGSYEEALDNTAEMILGWFDSMDDLGLKIPLPKRTVEQLRELLA